MTPAAPGFDTVIVVSAASPSEQTSRSRSQRAAEAPSVPSSYVVWEKER
jgi:hypothetical protein